MGALPVDNDLKQTWLRVVEDCDKTAGWDKNDKRTLTVDDVLGIIHPNEDIPSPTTKRAKKYVKNVLVCVQRFGDVIATGTSALFPPSQQCFNAVNFVIIATQKTATFFEDVTTLMERVSVFLESLRVYLDDEIARGSTHSQDSDDDVLLDIRLRPSVYRVLEHFIDIMKLTHQLAVKKKVERAKTFAKILLFGNDDRIKSALATLETRVSDVTRIQVAVIGQDLKGAARNLREMKGDIDLLLIYDQKHTTLLEGLKHSDEQRHTKEVERDDIEFIRAKIGLHDSDRWQDGQLRISEDRISGTGAWLLKRDDFSRWIDVQDESAPALFTISAGEGRGRRFLAHSIIEHALGTYTGIDPHYEVLVAYNYLSRSSRNQKSGTTPINQAVKSVIWQMVQHSQSYRKFLRDACEQHIDYGRTNQLWKKLVMGYRCSKPTALVLILDGVSDVSEHRAAGAIARLVLASAEQSVPDQPRIRLCLSGRLDGIQQLRPQFPIVRLDGDGLKNGDFPNLPDVEVFIDNRLNRMQKFKGEESLDKAKQRAKIQQVLSGNLQNDFYRLSLILREIDHCVNTKQLDEILAGVNEDISTKIERQIEILNRVLSQDEITELNALIAWLLVNRGATDLGTIEQYLSVSVGVVRLISLKQQIINVYNVVLDVVEHEVTKAASVDWKYGEVKEFLLNNGQTERYAKQYQLRQRRQFTFEPDEITLIKKIVKTNFANVFGKDDGSVVYDKYGFEEFFRSKSGFQTDRIRLDKGESHTTILKACLSVMTDDLSRPHLSGMRTYAYEYLMDHLENSDIDMADQRTKQDIARKLLRLLRDHHCIDHWWKELQKLRTRNRSFRNFSDHAMAWVRHLKDVTDVPGASEWIEKVDCHKRPDLVFYHDFACRAATYWLEEGMSVWPTVADLLLDHVDRWWFARGGAAYGPYLNREKNILIMEQWIKEELGYNDGDVSQSHAWHIRMAELLLSDRCPTAAARRCDAALEIDSLDWHAAAIKASTLTEDMRTWNTDDYFVCREFLLKMRAADRAGNPNEQSPTDLMKMKRTVALTMLCQCEIRLKDRISTNPTAAFLDVLKSGVWEGESTSLLSNVFGLLVKHLDSMSQFDEIIELLRELDRAETVKHRPLRVLLRFQDSKFHDCVFRVTETTKAFSTVHAIYQAATQTQDEVRVLTGGNVKDDIGGALYIRGKMLWYLGPEHTKDKALGLWEQAGTPKSLTELTKALWPKMKDAGFGSPVALRWTERLASALASETAKYLPGQEDPRLLLARFQHLNGLHDRANACVREVLATTGRTYGSLEIYRHRIEFGTVLASAYAVLDEDENALAAWNTVSPRKTGDGYGNEWIAGKKTFTCACGCHASQSFGADMVVCKDCVSKQFMPQCYARLKEGLLGAEICSKDHKHLTLPTWDEAKWIELSKDDKITFAGEAVYAAEWLQQQIDRWDLGMTVDKCTVLTG